MYLSQSQISGWRRKYCLRRRYKGHRIRRFSKGLSRHILVRQSLSAVFHGALTKSRPAIVPESAPFKTARSVCSGESTLCPLDWRRKDFLFHPLTNVCSPEMTRELFTSSLAFNGKGVATEFAEIIRKHWSIENNVHWTLDNCFNQDKIQAKNVNYLSARVTLNKIAFNLLTKKKEELIKSGMHRLSMDSLKQLCQSPADALETVYNILGTSRA